MVTNIQNTTNLYIRLWRCLMCPTAISEPNHYFTNGVILVISVGRYNGCAWHNALLQSRLATSTPELNLLTMFIQKRLVCNKLLAQIFWKRKIKVFVSWLFLQLWSSGISYTLLRRETPEFGLSHHVVRICSWVVYDYTVILIIVSYNTYRSTSTKTFNVSTVNRSVTSWCF